MSMHSNPHAYKQLCSSLKRKCSCMRKDVGQYSTVHNQHPITNNVHNQHPIVSFAFMRHYIKYLNYGIGVISSSPKYLFFYHNNYPFTCHIFLSFVHKQPSTSCIIVKIFILLSYFVVVYYFFILIFLNISFISCLIIDYYQLICYILHYTD